MKQFKTQRSELLLSFKYFYLHICFYYIFLTYNSNDTHTHTLSTISRKVSLLFFLPARVQDGLLYRCNYAASHHLYYTFYNACLGCVKDEGAGVPWKEAVVLNPKCYSMISLKDHEHKVHAHAHIIVGHLQTHTYIYISATSIIVRVKERRNHFSIDACDRV